MRKSDAILIQRKIPRKREYRVWIRLKAWELGEAEGDVPEAVMVVYCDSLTAPEVGIEMAAEFDWLHTSASACHLAED